ncbi:MAG: glutamyl-tRNA reductase [Bacteroidota bacterium]
MTSQFWAISLSHSNTPLHVRETFALNQEQQEVFSIKIRDLFQVANLLIVSTCNRTEIYYGSEKDLSIELIKALTTEKGLLDYSLYLPFFQIHSGIDAVKRLFEVASGLHSKVVGDLQIPNQVKQSYQSSADLDMAGPFMHRLMHTIFYTNKRIAQETSFRDGAASVTYVAVSLAEELTASIKNPKILILGLGEIGTDVCKYLSENKFGDVTVMNRTLSKAESYAITYGFKASTIDNLEDEVSKADLVISSIRAENPLITKTLILKNPPLSYKYLIDLSVPRSVEDNLEQISGILVYNIDTLQAKADSALAKRMEAVPEVQNIINESIESFEDWSKEVMVSPTIQKLKNALENIRKEEMGRYLKNLSPDESEKVEKITQSIIQKILKQPVIQLKAACKRGEADSMIEAINELFDLEKEFEGKEKQ